MCMSKLGTEELGMMETGTVQKFFSEDGALKPKAAIPKGIYHLSSLITLVLSRKT